MVWVPILKIWLHHKCCQMRFTWSLFHITVPNGKLQPTELQQGSNLWRCIWRICPLKCWAYTCKWSETGHHCHYSDVIMTAMVSQITGVSIVYSTVWSGADQRKRQSSASLAFMRGIHRWPVNSPHKRPVTRKMFPFNDVIMAPVDVIADNGTSPRSMFSGDYEVTHVLYEIYVVICDLR